MKRKITEELLKNFKSFMFADEKSNATIEKYLRDLHSFMVYVNDREVDKTLVLEYKAELAQVYALTSVNSMLAALNAFLRFTGWLDCCVKQFKIQKKAFCSEQTELSKAEYIALIRTAEKKNNGRLSLLIQTLCGTGIRVGEVEFITVEAT